MSVTQLRIFGDDISRDLEEMERYLSQRICEEIRKAVERMKSNPHYPILKPFIRAAFREYIEECKVEL